MDLTGLGKDTKHYYRVHYQAGGSGDAADNIHTFRTQRQRQSIPFRCPRRHPSRAIQQQDVPQRAVFADDAASSESPADLYFTLGDDFSSEKIIQDFKSANYPATYSFTRAVDGIAPTAATKR